MRFYVLPNLHIILQQTQVIKCFRYDKYEFKRISTFIFLSFILKLTNYKIYRKSTYLLYYCFKVKIITNLISNRHEFRYLIFCSSILQNLEKSTKMPFEYISKIT